MPLNALISKHRFAFLLGSLLFSCSHVEQTLELAYDLPAEAPEKTYDKFTVKGEQTRLRIRFMLPGAQTRCGLFFRSQFHNYFLEQIPSQYGQYDVSLDKSLFQTGVYEIGFCRDLSSPNVSYTGYFFSARIRAEKLDVTRRDSVIFGIEKFSLDSSNATIQGWAYLRNQSMTFRSIAFQWNFRC